MKSIIKNSILLLTIAAIYSCSKNERAKDKEEEFTLNLIPSDKLNEATLYFSFPKNTNLENIYFEFSGDAVWQHTRAREKLIKKETLIKTTDLVIPEPEKNFLTFTITRLIDNKELTLNLKDKDGKEIQNDIKTTTKIKGSGKPRVSIESIKFPKGQTTGEIVILFENGAEKLEYNKLALVCCNFNTKENKPPIFPTNPGIFEVQINNDPANTKQASESSPVDLISNITSNLMKLTIKDILPDDNATGNVRLVVSTKETIPQHSELFIINSLIIEKNKMQLHNF
jgi:hypothetical protein